MVFADELSADRSIGSKTNIFCIKYCLNKKRMGLLRLPQTGQEAIITHKPITKCPEKISEAGYECVYLNSRSIVNKKKLFKNYYRSIMGKTESWANIDITDAELGLTGYVMCMGD